MWPSVKLGEVLTERKEAPDPSKIDTGEIRVVEKISFNTGRIDFRLNGHTRTKMIAIHPGDLVISGINAPKGAIAIYGKDERQPIAATIHYGAYKVNTERATLKFLWWLLRSNTFRKILTFHLPGGIKTELKAKRLLPIPVPLPSLSEQQRIVKRIECLAEKIKEAHGLRLISVRETENLIKSCLNQLANQFSKFGILGEILTDKPRNGWSARCDNDETGYPVLTLGAVTGYSYKNSEFKRTSLPTNPDSHYWLKKGDLLITRSNTPELVGHAAVYDGSPSPCIYPDLIMRIPVDETKAIKRLVWYWLQSPMVREYIQGNAKGTSPTMKKISQSIVMNIPFPEKITTKEQHNVVSYLDDLQSKVTSLKTIQAQTQKELDALLPSILDRAFAGKL